jgi:hypothetical protein
LGSERLGGNGSGEDGSGGDGSGKNGSVGHGSVMNGSVAKKVAADPPSFNWFLCISVFEIWCGILILGLVPFGSKLYLCKSVFGGFDSKKVSN